jgi:hypothetical protein
VHCEEAQLTEAEAVVVPTGHALVYEEHVVMQSCVLHGVVRFDPLEA